jgi:hypothetical protein
MRDVRRRISRAGTSICPSPTPARKAVEARVAYPYIFYHFHGIQPVRAFHPVFGGVLEQTTTPIDISYPGPATFCMTAAVGLEHAVAVGSSTTPSGTSSSATSRRRTTDRFDS